MHNKNGQFNFLGEVFAESNKFTERRPIQNPKFEGDEDEMNDINDPNWDELRNLQSDEERRLFAMRNFGNWQPANPMKNLTYYGYLRQSLQKKDNIEP